LAASYAGLNDHEALRVDQALQTGAGEMPSWQANLKTFMLKFVGFDGFSKQLTRRFMWDRNEVGNKHQSVY